MTDKLLLVKERLQELKKLDPEFHAFGSHVWKYNLKKCSKWKIRRFERRNGITLPTEFAEFINQIGFGAAPVYGVNPNSFLSVEKWDYEESQEYLQPLFDGYIVVAHHGCGKETMIIIDGIHKGEIWQYSAPGLNKINDSYYNWYFSWTENLIKILKGNGHIGILSGSL